MNKLRNFLFPPSIPGQIVAFILYAGGFVGAAFLVRWAVGLAGAIVATSWISWAAFSLVIFIGFYLYGRAAWK